MPDDTQTLTRSSDGSMRKAPRVPVFAKIVWSSNGLGRAADEMLRQVGRHLPLSLFVIIIAIAAGGLLSVGTPVEAAEPTDRRVIPAEIGPERIVLTDGLQVYMFQTGKGTLVAMAWMSLPPGHELPEINIFPGIPGWVISRDKGKSWKRWTPKGIVSATPYEPPAPAPGFEGSAAQLSDGMVIILEWVATGRRKDRLWTGNLWESKDDCRTLQGPIEMTIDLPNAKKTFDDSGRPGIGICFHRSLLELPNGDLLTTVYGAFKQDTAPVPYQPKLMKMRCVLLRSSDRGRSWKYASTIAVDPQVGQEGFDEPVMVRLSKGPKAGRLICLMRTGRDTPLYQAHSDDDGATWSVPRELGFFGVDPDLVEMSDGTLVGGYVWLKAGDNGKPAAGPTAAFPEKLTGRLPQLGLSRPAQRSLAFRPACSLNRPRRSVTLKASTNSLPPPPLQLLPAGATRRRVGIAPTGDRRLSRRTVYHRTGLEDEVHRSTVGGRQIVRFSCRGA